VCDKARKAIKKTECRFVFDKLLELESEYPVTHFVATDGSKDIHEETGATRISRVCLAVASEALVCSVLGGQLDVYADTFERHSYEAELAAFHDHLAATANSVTVVVTDCLSGMQAGHAFPGRTVSAKNARYRDKELGNISELEQRHRAVLYVHVHSHDGITPNEAADATATFMLDSPILPMDLMPSAHAKCRIAGIKRGAGRAAYDFCHAFMMAKLAGASSFTLLETAETWPLFCRAPVRAKLLTEATRDLIMDARADRCGLLADRLGDEVCERVLIGNSQRERERAYRAQKGGWEWWCQTHASCPCTGCFQARDVIVAGVWRPPPARAPQSRWHALTTCCIGESAAYRAGNKRFAMLVGVGRPPRRRGRQPT
jgi:ribonuclease HI